MSRSAKHFKIHCSIRNHRKTVGLYTDNDLFAAYIRLGMMAVERFADRTGDSFLADRHDIEAITGKRRGDVALKLLERLANVTPTSVQREGEVWRIKLPKFAIKQGFRPRNGSGMGDTATATATPTPKEKEFPPSGGMSAGKKTVKTPKTTLCPEVFSAAEKREIHEWNKSRSKPFTNAELREGFETMRDWSLAEKKKKASWTASFKNQLKDGWVLKGADSKTKQLTPTEQAIADLAEQAKEDE